MEIAALAISAVSLVALFDTAIEGYKLLRSAAQNLPRDGRFLVTKFLVEEYRFALWGKYLGISQNEECKPLFQLSKPTQTIILAMLTEVASIVADVEVLKTRYSLVPSTSELPELEIPPDLLDTPNSILRSPSVLQMETQTRHHIEHKISRGKKWRWAIGDGARFADLVEKLHYLNDSLYHCLSPVRASFLSQGLPFFMLPSIEDVATLSDLRKVTTVTQPILANSAELKRLNIETSDVDVNNITGLLDINRSALDIFETQGMRSLANYIDGNAQKPVLIEWKEIRKDLDETLKVLIRKRIRALARLLSAPKSADFHLLMSGGLVTPIQNADQISRVEENYGYVFELPPGDVDSDSLPVTLSELLSRSADKLTPTPNLGDRFKLAKILSVTVGLLHASKWLHKGLRSQNIIFFRHKSQLMDTPTSIVSPYLIGFDYSRPDVPGELSGEHPDYCNREFNLYRHPACQGPPDQTRFRREHDIYSLGVLLFEIAVWRPLIKFYPVSMTPQEFKELLLESCAELGPRMGVKYRDVVIRCLTGDFGVDFDATDDTTKLQRAFWSKVIRELEGCQA